MSREKKLISPSPPAPSPHVSAQAAPLCATMSLSAAGIMWDGRVPHSASLRPFFLLERWHICKI